MQRPHHGYTLHVLPCFFTEIDGADHSIQPTLSSLLLPQKRCNRRNPCQICTSRGIKCVPQIRGPGRPPGSKSSRGSSSSSSLTLGSSRHGGSRGDVRSSLNSTQHSTNSSATTSAASSTASSLSRSLSGNGLLQQEQDLVVVAAAASTRQSPPRDPWHCRFFFEAARHCKEAFLKAWHDNELDTSKCIMLRYVRASFFGRLGYPMCMGRWGSSVGHSPPFSHSLTPFTFPPPLLFILPGTSGPRRPPSSPQGST